MKKLKDLLNRAQARIAALFAAALVAVGVYHGAAAQVQTDTVTWTNPTTYTDGSTIAAADMKETRVQWGATSGGPYDGGQSTTAWPGVSSVFSRSGTGVGKRCYVMISVSKAGSGIESVPSAETCKTIAPPPPTPNPPTNVSVK